MAYREQVVKIALGPRGAFEDGNIGTLSRQVPGDRIVNAVLPSRGNPKPPKEPKTPRVVELLDHKGLLTQLAGLERRTSRAGKDSVDHPPGPGARDDVANAVAVVLTLRVRPLPGFFVVGPPC